MVVIKCRDRHICFRHVLDVCLPGFRRGNPPGPDPARDQGAEPRGGGRAVRTVLAGR